METSNTQKKGKDMSIWIILAVIAVWVLLQGYILPKMGIST
jgi:flagellar basal body-associated protein FliL